MPPIRILSALAQALFTQENRLQCRTSLPCGENLPACACVHLPGPLTPVKRSFAPYLTKARTDAALTSEMICCRKQPASVVKGCAQPLPLRGHAATWCGCPQGLSCVQLRAREGPYLDDLASPEIEEPAASEGLGVSIEALLQGLPAHKAAILRLRMLEGQSLRRAALATLRGRLDPG